MSKRTNAIAMCALMLALASATPAWAAVGPASNGAAAADPAPVTADGALKTALDAAAVDGTDAVVYQKVWEFEDGVEKYEVHFLIPGQVKYEYEIDAQTGRVLKGETELWEAEDEVEYAALAPVAPDDPEEADKALEKALQTALADAGVKDGEAIVYKRGTDFENGKSVYTVGFLLAGKAKFEYDIDKLTGKVLTSDRDQWDVDDDLAYEQLISPDKEKAAEASGDLSDADALAIAFGDAGLSESDALVTECSKGIDDGIEQFEVTLRTADGIEYEYEIDAKTGSILEKSVEREDD